MTYAQITLAISDDCRSGLEGFAPLSGRLPASVFAEAIEDGQSMDQSGASYSLFVDLMSNDYNQIGEKCISLEQAAQFLRVAPEALVPMGRQTLARLDDEAADHCRANPKERP